MSGQRREVRDIWSAVAKARRKAGDRAGAAQATQNAKITSGDDRPRHDGKKRASLGVYTTVKLER